MESGIREICVCGIRNPDNDLILESSTKLNPEFPAWNTDWRQSDGDSPRDRAVRALDL